jgi:hypothetical protein
MKRRRRRNEEEEMKKKEEEEEKKEGRRRRRPESKACRLGKERATGLKREKKNSPVFICP